MAVGGVICCGRWAAGLAGCGVGRCWRWAAGCCEVWQGVQAVQLVGCGVIGAALAVLGYSGSEVAAALKGIDIDILPLEEIIRQALKRMVK